MFALRGLAVSLSIFVLVYGSLSIAACMVWRKAWLIGQRFSPAYCADLLFILRLTPFVIAALVTLALTVPSFVLLEPRATAESLGAAAVTLSLGGLILIGMGAGKAVLAWLRASRTISRWSGNAQRISPSGTASMVVDFGRVVPVLRASVAPALTAAGILHPSVWLSNATASILSEHELACAVRHEFVHVRRRDNLRKLLLRFLAFPGFAAMETAWREATEMAADDAAVSNATEALDLAAAVIKLSRLSPRQPVLELTTSLVHTPAESVNARVERLIKWCERPQQPARKCPRGYPFCAALAILSGTALSYHPLLLQVHRATEWLVR